MINKRWFWMAVVLQILILFGMVARHAYTLTTGQPVVLKVAPLDPWDALRGEYVSLTYDISRVDTQKISAQGAPYRPKQVVWVTLKKGQKYWEAVALSDKRPQASAAEVILRGMVLWSDLSEVTIRYGIEQFYVPQGEGPKLEEHRADMSVEVLVDSYGRAALKRVFVAEQEVQFR